MVHLAGGAEWRDERSPSEKASRSRGRWAPYAAQGFVSGSNGYQGFPDYTAGTWTRAKPPSTATSSCASPAADGPPCASNASTCSARRRTASCPPATGWARAVSVRGGVSTGCRAPTPGQQDNFSVHSTIDPRTLDVVDGAIVPSTYLAAQLRAAGRSVPRRRPTRRPGLVVDTGGFTLTAEYFHVDVANRLALSQNFTLGADARASLLSEGITSARTLAFFRFFINDFSTRTRGIDVVSTYAPPGLEGDTVFSLALNHTATAVTKASELLSPGDVLALERGVPKTRWNVAVNQRAGRVGLLGRLHYYGPWIDNIDARSARGADAQVLGGRILALEASVVFARDVTLAIGGQNVFTPSRTGWTCSRRGWAAVQPVHAVGTERRVLLRATQLRLGG